MAFLQQIKQYSFQAEVSRIWKKPLVSCINMLHPSNICLCIANRIDDFYERKKERKGLGPTKAGVRLL